LKFPPLDTGTVTVAPENTLIVGAFCVTEDERVRVPVTLKMLLVVAPDTVVLENTRNVELVCVADVFVRAKELLALKKQEKACPVRVIDDPEGI
jgi:hypothetical protein